MKLEGHVFVVTGGASGLGAATAKMLACSGATVVVADLRESLAQALVEELGRNATYISTDVTQETDVQRAFEFATQQGVLRGLVNCAGIAPGEKVMGKNGLHSLESFTRTLEVNLIGTFNTTRWASKFISENEPIDGERGVIVNTASIAAYDGQIGQAAYAASKGGIVSMTLPLARELGRFGIRVMTIAPGVFETPMLLGMSKEVQESLAKTIPFPSRMGKPEEFADLVGHIISNHYLNGEVIRLDGANRMMAK